MGGKSLNCSSGEQLKASFLADLFCSCAPERRDQQLPVPDAPEHLGGPVLQRPDAVPRLPLDPGRLRLRGDGAVRGDGAHDLESARPLGD